MYRQFARNNLSPLPPPHTQFSVPSFVSSPSEKSSFKRFVPLLRAHLHRRLRRRTLRRKHDESREEGRTERGKKIANERTCERRCLITRTRQFAHAVHGKFFHGETLLYNYKVIVQWNMSLFFLTRNYIHMLSSDLFCITKISDYKIHINCLEKGIYIY